MKKILLLMVTFLICGAISNAQMIALETFDYESDTLEGQGIANNGFAGPWTTFVGVASDFAIDTGSAYSGLIVSDKKLVGTLSQKGGSRIARELKKPIKDNGEPVWLSLLITVENFDTSHNNVWAGVTLWGNDLAITSGEYLLIGKNFGKEYYGCEGNVKNGSGNNKVSSDVSYLTGQAWIVAKIDFTASADDEPVYFWVNHSNFDEEPSNENADTAVVDFGDEGATHIVCHFGDLSSDSGTVMMLDEIRVGKTYSDVVVEDTLQIGISASQQMKLNSKCYPNPFKMETNIEFSVNSSEYVKLEVYNMIGTKIEVLEDGIVSPNRYRYNWNAESLPNGMYFYRLQIGNKHEIGKMLIE